MADVLIVLGIMLVFIGLLWKVFPALGRLPGDIVIKGDGYTIYIPIITSIILSILLTIAVNIIFKILGGGWR